MKNTSTKKKQQRVLLFAHIQNGFWPYCVFVKHLASLKKKMKRKMMMKQRIFYEKTLVFLVNMFVRALFFRSNAGLTSMNSSSYYRLALNFTWTYPNHHKSDQTYVPINSSWTTKKERRFSVKTKASYCLFSLGLFVWLHLRYLGFVRFAKTQEAVSVKLASVLFERSSNCSFLCVFFFSYAVLASILLLLRNEIMLRALMQDKLKIKTIHSD